MPLLSGFQHTTEWEYDRRWHAIDVVDHDLSLVAKDKLRLWGRLLRWTKYPELGEPPAHWLKYGPPPDGIAFAGVAMTAHYSAPIAEQINAPNTLLSMLGRA